jgi:hypothetical protein
MDKGVLGEDKSGNQNIYNDLDLVVLRSAG